MQLVRQLPEGYLSVRRVESRTITVGDRPIAQSFLLMRDRLVEGWPVTSVAALGADAIARILELEPDVVILGTGERQSFPPAKVQAEFLTRGIGFEVMDNSAAARTYNVLVSEGRNALVAFMLPDAAPAPLV